MLEPAILPDTVFLIKTHFNMAEITARPKGTTISITTALHGCFLFGMRCDVQAFLNAVLFPSVRLLVVHPQQTSVSS